MLFQLKESINLEIVETAYESPYVSLVQQSRESGIHQRGLGLKYVMDEVLFLKKRV